MPTELRLTLEGFLRAFQAQDRNQPDHPFCFILGAGASKPSGVRTGAELARFFVEEMYHAENFGSEAIEKWATAERLGIAGFDLARAEEFYPQLYLRKFGEHPDRGYAFLEQEMGGREPSYGYSVLAWILAQAPHKVVVTTNFDNLVADGISIHSSTFPRIVGHESLAGFVQAALRRPLVAKIHGDLGFALRNTPKEIAELSDQWKTALKRVFERFTPIVIGYGGNDGSLMGTLEALPPGVPECIYWCQREDSPVSPRVMKLLEQKKGNLVLIPGFDELMLKIQDYMRSDWKMPDLLAEMKKRQRDREKSYEEQRERIATALTVQSKEAVVRTKDQVTARKTETSEERDLADAAVRILAPGEKAKPWWQWVMEAEREQDLERKDNIFNHALREMPQEPGLLGSYAIFLRNQRKDFDRAEEFYKRAIEADPKLAHNLGSYANFLAGQRKDFDRAEEFYKRAIEADPKHANNLGNYAGFLLSLGKTTRGLDLLSRAESLVGENPNLAVELAFYRLAHDPKERNDHFDRLKKLLESSARSPGWVFERNIERAEKDGFPNVPLLRALAKVTNDQAPLSTLDAFGGARSRFKE